MLLCQTLACGTNLARSVIVFGLQGNTNHYYSWPADIIQHMYCSYYKSQNALLNQHRTFIEGHYYYLIVWSLLFFILNVLIASG